MPPRKMREYKFDYTLHQTIHAPTKKEATKIARETMRSRQKRGAWWEAKVHEVER